MKKTINTRLLAGTILATLLVSLPASATSLLVPEATTAMAQPSNGTETGEANAQTTPAPDTVDLAALYYYARNGEAERVEAETRRLELKFPGFMPRPTSMLRMLAITSMRPRSGNSTSAMTMPASSRRSAASPQAIRAGSPRRISAAS